MKTFELIEIDEIKGRGGEIIIGLQYDEVADCVTVQELNDVVEGILTFK